MLLAFTTINVTQYVILLVYFGDKYKYYLNNDDSPHMKW